MIISIFGTNGMLSSYLATFFSQRETKNVINLLGNEKPNGTLYTNYYYIDLLSDEIDYHLLLKSDLILYASGTGVQASIKADSEVIYQVNLSVPIDICCKLKKYNYKGIYVSFGSYMEIGLNDNKNAFFDEKQIELSKLPVTNDYALSKRLLTRFMGNLIANFRFWHFILPNIFIKDDFGTRLIPYVLSYLRKTKNREICDFPKFSSGNQVRQFVNFEDVCLSLTKCLEYDIPSGVYNIGGGEILSVKELIVRLFNHFQLPIYDEMFGKDIRRDGDIKSLKLNGDKLKKVIGYLPDQQIESIL